MYTIIFIQYNPPAGPFTWVVHVDEKPKNPFDHAPKDELFCSAMVDDIYVLNGDQFDKYNLRENA